ncbi:hypothetical protein R7F11_17615 [Vibrio sp. Vb5035]|nr:MULTISPECIES: hypothetical protein [unclassified Vibrio]MDW1516400.1 hypothetical protein [Vibrio sp. Vb5035]MDW1546355.1 hypothetical protein [Vibrio sp. Vb5034]
MSSIYEIIQKDPQYYVWLFGCLAVWLFGFLAFWVDQCGLDRIRISI